MKKIFIGSLLFNVTLLGGLVFLWPQPKPEVVVSTPPVQAAPGPVADVSAPAVQAPPRVEVTPFRWSQLDAADYHVYVKNLRAIGCPEASVRAIVAADVHAYYDPQAKALEKKISDLENGSWSAQLAAYQTNEALKVELSRLPGQENALLADLLGLKPAPVQMAATTGTTATEGQSQPDQPVSAPMALQEVDLSALNLTEDQQQEIATIRQNFVQQIGGTNQDPNDPAYLARWQKAQPVADEMLRGMMGNRVYEQYQMAQLKQSVSENQGAPPP